MCPGPGGGDFQAAPAAAAGQARGGMQDPVTQGLGFGSGQVAVQGESRSQDSKVAAINAAASHAG